MVLLTEQEQPELAKLPAALRTRAERLPPHQRDDLIFVYEYERVHEGAPRNDMSDWLRRLQRAREHGWLATVPPEERQ
eukprot:2939732-Prymnesium_polylepis.1